MEIKEQVYLEEIGKLAKENAMLKAGLIEAKAEINKLKEEKKKEESEGVEDGIE